MRTRAKRPIAWAMMALTVAWTGAAAAQELPDLRDARGLVFAEDGAIEWQILPDPSLTAADLATLDQINRIQPQAYYGAMAIAPSQGLAAATTSMAANFHDEANARTAALAACDSARGDDGSPCVVVMVIRPAGWQPGRALQLSSEAAAALRSDYRRLARRSRAMAISPGTGQWGIGAGRDAAIAACAAADCRVVVEG